jgi:galactonate dehydratase
MNRRNLLLSSALLPFSGAPACAEGRMTLERLEIFRVHVNRRGSWILVRARSSSGLTGIGDASHGGPDDRKIQMLREMFSLWKGRSAGETEVVRLKAQTLIEQHGVSAAIAFSAIEQCCWDILGKAAGVPAYELFGGSLRENIRNYANLNRATEDRTPAGFATMAAKAVDAGFDAFKLAPFDGMPLPPPDDITAERFMQLGLDCAAAVRKVIGPKRDLLIDVHSRVNLQRGLELARRFEPLQLFWLEEVVKEYGELAAINQAAKMPTAGGEAIYGVREFHRYISSGAVDILMPDVKYCGGMLELKKIAAMAEAAGMPLSPHGPASPVGNIAAAHVCATMPNFLILEYAFGEVPWRAELIDPPEMLVKGQMTVSQRPGLGIELNERTIGRHLVGTMRL